MPVGVGQTHPSYEVEAALARLLIAGFARLDRHSFARARELTRNFKTASYSIPPLSGLYHSRLRSTLSSAVYRRSCILHAQDPSARELRVVPDRSHHEGNRHADDRTIVWGKVMPATVMRQQNGISSRGKKRSALELYLKDIAYNDLLTPQQEVTLAKRIRAGDRKSLEQMVESNLRFVITIAKEYQGRGLPLEDLIAEGNLGLVRAATRYDETVGVKFTTYAVWWIRQGILSSLAEKARMVRLPVNKIKHLCRLERIASSLKQELGREPSIDEIARGADMQPKQAQDLFNASRWHVSLDMPLEEGPDSSLLEVLEDKDQVSPENVVMEQAMADEIRAALDTLSTREARILRLYFGINGEDSMTLEQIGNQLSLTKERVRQIRDKALASLKHPSRVRKIRAYLTEN